MDFEIDVAYLDAFEQFWGIKPERVESQQADDLFQVVYGDDIERGLRQLVAL